MSTGRNPSNQPLKPAVANRNARPTLGPRIATRPSPTIRSEPPATKLKPANHETPAKELISNSNITPRSSARKSKVDSPGAPTLHPEGTPSAAGSRVTVATSNAGQERIGNIGGLGLNGVPNKARLGRPKSLVSDNGLEGKAQVGGSQVEDSIDSRFFHASDAHKHEPTVKGPKFKKPSAFFYADGQQESRPSPPPRSTSPIALATSDHPSTGPWIRSGGTSNPSKSPPMLSPALSALSASSPFFTSTTSNPGSQRSPSPSKENIHLSYRKGASQIFGTRPTPASRASNMEPSHVVTNDRTGGADIASTGTPHRKSPSLSSIDSGNSQQSRQRSLTMAENTSSPSPLAHEVKAATIPMISKPPQELPNIDTSLKTSDLPSPLESTLSPTKGISELAAEARRERKVLDLEISNSSLLAINASLEREVRRQKTELKRFRRLSRAGHFSLASSDRSARFSEGLSAVGEIDEDDENPLSGFDPTSSPTNLYDDISDDEDDSLASSTAPTSPSGTSKDDNDRLAKDEKRLRVDLNQHKELLVQSQMVNQSIKRCMYVTEAMIGEGKKALEYHVRVSDVKLGGRVLSSHEDDDRDESREIEIEDDLLHGDSVEQAKGFLEVWSGLGRPSYESSDRDSGIEVDRPVQPAWPVPNLLSSNNREKPPDEKNEGLELV